MVPLSVDGDVWCLTHSQHNQIASETSVGNSAAQKACDHKKPACRAQVR